MHSIILNIILQFFILSKAWSYEEYIILPENSEYCSSYPAFRRFSLSRQMGFTSGAYNDSWNHLIYVCKVRVYPNGRLLQYTYPQGLTSFWFHRLKVDIHFTSCSDKLKIGFIPEEITQPGLSPENATLTCHESYPKVFDSKHRIVSISWHTATGSTEKVSSKVSVQMSAYMRFEGKFGLSDKIQRCESGSGFWCGNETSVCIYGQMRCDQADGCFDGGTDELGCPPPRNYTSAPEPRTPSSWSVFLPWSALCLIPLVLIFVLGLICTPRKAALDEFDTCFDEDSKFNHLSASASSSISSSECGSFKSVQSACLPSPTSRAVVTNPILRSCSSPVLFTSSPSGPTTDLYADRPHPPQISGAPSKSEPPLLPPKSSLSQYRSPFQKLNKVVSFRVPNSNRNSDCSKNYTKFAGVDQRPFPTMLVPDERIAIPAEFEMAALNVRSKEKPHAEASSCSFSPNHTVAHKNPNRSGTENVGIVCQSVPIGATPIESCSSDDSYREDVTPFRKPDSMQHDCPAQLTKSKRHMNGVLSSVKMDTSLSAAKTSSLTKKPNRNIRLKRKSDYVVL